MSPGTITARKTDIYNDPSFDYAKFWARRSYEHEAEVIALRRLLDGHRFGTAVDIGGGYGRLSVILTEYADQVTLTDPSTQQLSLAERVFPGGPPFTRQLMDAAHLRFADDSTDLVTLIRVLHHLPDPSQSSRSWRGSCGLAGTRSSRWPTPCTRHAALADCCAVSPPRRNQWTPAPSGPGSAAPPRTSIITRA
jgi:SAM-dependent methyltransferase